MWIRITHHCEHATASRTLALISVKLAHSQTPAHTARPLIRASVSRDVPVYSPSFR